MSALLIAELATESGNRHELWLDDGCWTKVTHFPDGGMCRVVTDRIAAHEFYELCEHEGTVHQQLAVAR